MDTLDQLQHAGSLRKHYRLGQEVLDDGAEVNRTDLKP